MPTIILTFRCDHTEIKRAPSLLKDEIKAELQALGSLCPSCTQADWERSQGIAARAIRMM